MISGELGKLGGRRKINFGFMQAQATPAELQLSHLQPSGGLCRLVPEMRRDAYQILLRNFEPIDP